jgi:hypothetical protein
LGILSRRFALISEFGSKWLGIREGLDTSTLGIAFDNDIDNTSAKPGPFNAASAEFGVALLVIIDPIVSRAAEIELEMDSVTIGSIRRRTLTMHTGGQSCIR